MSGDDGIQASSAESNYPLFQFTIKIKYNDKVSSPTRHPYRIRGFIFTEVESGNSQTSISINLNQKRKKMAITDLILDLAHLLNATNGLEVKIHSQLI